MATTRSLMVRQTIVGEPERRDEYGLAKGRGIHLVQIPASRLATRLELLRNTLRPTPHLQLAMKGMNLFAKLEYVNPVGSIKDRAAYWILRRAAERGEICEETVIESSSGNFAAALAAFTHLVGLRFLPVIDPNISGTYESFLRRLCPTVVKVQDRDDTGGFLKTRLQKVKELCATIPNAYWTNQYGNLDAIEAHYELTATEICADFDSLDYVFIGVSTAGTIAGVSRRLKEHYPNIRVIAVDTEGSAIFGGAPRKRHIPGIGSSIVPQLLSYAKIDDIVLISERDTVQACRELLTSHGLFVGGSSGTAFAAVKRYAARMPAYKHPTVLFLCADRGTPYLDTVFDPTWATRLEWRSGEAMHFELSIINGKSVFDIVRAHRSECIRIVQEAYLAHARGQSVNPDSYFLRFPEKPDCRIIALPAYLGNGFDVAGLKWIASYPANIQRGFPRASAVLVLNNYETGYPFAILESSIISAARTAASASLAAHWLSGQSHRAHSLGIVGTGFIARYVYEFLVDTGWTIEEVRLHDRSPLESEKFRNTACRLEQHRTVTVVPDVAQLVRACDLILFTTVASTPHIADATLFEHNPLVLHISLRDLAPEILLRSQNVVDDVEHVMKANTSPHLAEQKTGNRSFVTGTLADIMIGRRSVNRSRPIIFSPFGMGILDLAVGKWVYDQAVASGQELRLSDFFYETVR